MRLPFAVTRLERIFRFLIGGGSAAAVNMVLAYIGIDLLGLRSVLQQNLVNLAAMELSLIYSFFIYRAFVWQIRNRDLAQIFLRQLPLYHLSAGTGILTRVLVFPLLQALGVHYLLNVALGILAGAGMNYILSNRYVFKDPITEKSA
jgi:dolichol-phosphate mannosyltransferase